MSSEGMQSNKDWIGVVDRSTVVFEEEDEEEDEKEWEVYRMLLLLLLSSKEGGLCRGGCNTVKLDEKGNVVGWWMDNDEDDGFGLDLEWCVILRVLLVRR